MNKFRRVAFFLLAACACLGLQAARQIGLEADAFNRICPASFLKNIVFSPASFEIDCAVIAESLETIPKANVSENLGVVLDFEGMYAPIVSELAVRTNGFVMTSARGFCVPEMKYALPAFRQYLERVYGVEVMRLMPIHGVESWFRAAMDGEMEEFSLPLSVARSERFSYYDLISLDISWLESFPTENTRKIKFYTTPESEPKNIVAMSDVRLADTYEAKEYTVLRLPLKGGAWFYAMLPKAGHGLDEARLDFSTIEINHLLSVMSSVSDPGVAHGPCAIVLPRMRLKSRLNFGAALAYFRVPASGLVNVAGPRSAQEFVQIAKFSLNEHGRGEVPLASKPIEAQIPLTKDVKRLIFNRPFLFFVYHEPTQTIPIVGQYCGEE